MKNFINLMVVVSLSIILIGCNTSGSTGSGSSAIKVLGFMSNDTAQITLTGANNNTYSTNVSNKIPAIFNKSVPDGTYAVSISNPNYILSGGPVAGINGPDSNNITILGGKPQSVLLVRWSTNYANAWFAK